MGRRSATGPNAHIVATDAKGYPPRRFSRHIARIEKEKENDRMLTGTRPLDWRRDRALKNWSSTAGREDASSAMSNASPYWCPAPHWCPAWCCSGLGGGDGGGPSSLSLLTCAHTGSSIMPSPSTRLSTACDVATLVVGWDGSVGSRGVGFTVLHMPHMSASLRLRVGHSKHCHWVETETEAEFAVPPAAAL